MKKRMLALTLAVSMLLSLAACGGGTKATAMHLRKTEGKVSVSDDRGRDLEPREDLGLYSGYGVDTRRESYAWIDLDKVKLTKLDEKSEIEITREGKNLEIEVLSGSLFFNVTEPLAGDETMTIRTSTMVVGIRGTCGWVALSEDEEQLSVYLLEGKVRCEAEGEEETVRAGEMAVMTEDGEITVEKFTVADVPAFVMEEIEDDKDLIDAILDSSGIDVTGAAEGDVLDEYADVLAEIDGEILYSEMVDFEADGNPELLVLYVKDGYASNREADFLSVSFQICRNGPEGLSRLFGGTCWIHDKHYRDGKLSLVESGGRLFLKMHNVYEGGTEGSTVYTTENDMFVGSVAQKDGGSSEWGEVDIIMCTNSTYNGHSEVRYTKNKYNELGFADRGSRPDGNSDNLSAEDYESIRGQYKEEKVLVYTPDNASLVVTPDPSEIEGVPQPADSASLD